MTQIRYNYIVNLVSPYLKIKNIQAAKLNYLVLAFYIAIGLLIYSGSLHYGYFLDDFGQIVNNNIIHNLKYWYLTFTGSTMADATTGATQGGIYYKPIMMMAYSVFWKIGNGDSFPFRLFQLFLHCINSYLVFKVFSNLLSKNSTQYAFLGGLVFLCHPINSEAILFIADLQEPLYTFFGLSALIKFIKSKYNYQFIFIGALLLASLLSKESGMLFIVTILTYGLIFRRETLLHLMLTLGVVITTYLLLRLCVASLTSLHSDNTALARADFFTRLSTVPKVLIHYIHLFIYPNAISLTQDWIVTELTATDFLGPLLEVLLIFLGFGFYLKRNFDKLNLFFFLMFLFGWGLHSQIIPLDGTVSDRWFYFTIIGFLGMILRTLELELGVCSIKLFVVGVSICFAFSIKSYSRTLDWKSDLALYSHDVAIDPDSFYLNNNLGLAYLENKQYSEALLCFQKTANVSANRSSAWYTAIRNIGAVYLNTKDYKQAEAFFKISLEDNSVLGFRGFAGALQGQTKYEDLHNFLESTALKKFPGDPILLKIKTESPKK